VAADIILPSVWNDSTEVGESTLDNHFPWDTIESSRYEKVNMVQPDLAELAKRSSARIATNKEFAYLKEDIERVQKQRAEKTVSLNEKQQLADRAQIISAHKLREEERATRKVAEPKVFDLTVAQSSLPGLPPPSHHTNDVSSADDDAGLEAPPASNDRDELSDALTSENDHAETARLQEAKNILSDYISLMKNGPGKPNMPLLAQ
jgi:carboxyl-terminal processing protease